MWGCVHTYVGQEEAVVRNLSKVGDRRNGPRDGYESFCPHFVVPNVVKSRGRAVAVSAQAGTTRVPLFPGYVFVNLESDRQWLSINSTRGVIRVLTDLCREDPHPLRVPDLMIEKLRTDRVDTRLIEVDTRVVVRRKGHPFADFEGVVTRLSTKQRVWVLMSMFDGKVEVVFEDPADLEVVAP